MKEIVFIRESTANMGGIQWQIVKLAEKLFSQGCFKPVLITSDKQSPFAQAFAACGFEVLSVPMGNTKIISAAGQILRLLKGKDVAVIQTHLLRESLIGRIVRKKRAGYQAYIPCRDLYRRDIKSELEKRAMSFARQNNLPVG